MTPRALALDLAWGGTGWCLATPDGPVVHGWARFRGDHRLDALLDWWRDEVAPAVLEVDLARGGDDPLIRPCIERPPWVYSRGNQAATLYGMGTIAGIVTCLAAHDDRLADVWDLPSVNEEVKVRRKPAIRHGWRPWWGYDTGERSRIKRHAIGLVFAQWPHVFDGLRLDEALEDWDGKCGDVAEAVLQGVGAARNPSHVAPVLVEDLEVAPTVTRAPRGRGGRRRAPRGGRR